MTDHGRERRAERRRRAARVRYERWIRETGARRQESDRLCPPDHGGGGGVLRFFHDIVAPGRPMKKARDQWRALRRFRRRLPAFHQNIKVLLSHPAADRILGKTEPIVGVGYATAMHFGVSR